MENAKFEIEPSVEAKPQLKLKENSKCIKDDLVEYINTHTELKKSEISSVVNLLFFVLGEKLVEGQTVEIRNFGVFEVRQRKERTNARNPKTGEILHAEAYKTIFFRPGKHIKMQLNAKENSGLVEA